MEILRKNYMIDKIEIAKNYLYYKSKKFETRKKLEEFQEKKIKKH